MMRKISFVLVTSVFILLTTLSPCLAQEGDVAMVMNLSGQAIYQTGKKAEQPLSIAAFLYSGDQILLKEGGSMVLIYSASGIREELTGPGIVRIGKTKSEIRDTSLQVRRTDADYLPDSGIIRTDVRFAATPLRGYPETDPDHIRLLGLCDTNIRSLRPEFRWQASEGAEKYQLTIFNEKKEAIFETMTTETSFVSGETVLHHGKAYQWRIAALSGNKPFASGKGRFSVLGKEQVRELEQNENAIKARFPGKTPEHLITLAMVYQKYELADEAVDMVRQVQAYFPENKNIRSWMFHMDTCD